MPEPRIYLDNAATSWPKPPSVVEAMVRFLQTDGGSAGRGGHAAAEEARRIVEEARRLIAELIGATHADSVALTFNGTDSLNAGIRGVLRTGDHVVTTVCEHNSVLRPLFAAKENLGCEVSLVQCDQEGVVAASDVLSAVREDTRLLAITHASNVTGAIQPVEEICRGLAGSPTLVLVDAAQTAGHVPIEVEGLRVDMLAASGHKGLLGPTGTGFLYLRPGVEQQLSLWRCGGTGSHSESLHHPQQMPDRLEAGNPNVVGLVGLIAGIEFLKREGIPAIGERVGRLSQRLRHGLAELNGCRVLGPTESSKATPVVSAVFQGYDPHEAGSVLEMTAGVQSRAGLHCAPLMHQQLGTAQGGAVRFSPGVFSTAEQIDRTLCAVHALVSP